MSPLVYSSMSSSTSLLGPNAYCGEEGHMQLETCFRQLLLTCKALLAFDQTIRMCSLFWDWCSHFRRHARKGSCKNKILIKPSKPTSVLCGCSRTMLRHTITWRSSCPIGPAF